jgi:spore coat protein JB
LDHPIHPYGLFRHFIHCSTNSTKKEEAWQNLSDFTCIDWDETAVFNLLREVFSLNQTKPEQTELPEDATGILPTNAPLSNPYVPFQREGSKKYDARFGLVRGTLFPGLDLPFMGMVNTSEQSDTPLHELQALDFAIEELGLYLDTHPNDKEALELFTAYVDLYQAGVTEYQRRYGPLTQMQAGRNGTYDWVNHPWPWEPKTEG